MEGKPCCEPCIELLRRPVTAILFVAGAALVSVMLGVAVRRADLSPAIAWALWGAGTAVAVAGAILARRRTNRRRQGLRVEPRPATPTDTASLVAPYRGHLRRVGRAVAPPLSGTTASLVVVGAFALAASAVPATLGLPRWLELEAVLGLWWSIWTAVFAVLLYRGWRLARDFAPPGPVRDEGPPPAKEKDAEERWWHHLEFSPDVDGCLIALGLVLVVALGFAAAWLVAELLLPALLAVVYWLLVRGLARVGRDRHGCDGNLGKSLAWGALWASLYTAPLALVVWLARGALGG